MIIKRLFRQMLMRFPVINYLLSPNLGEGFGAVGGGIVGESQHAVLLLPTIPLAAAADIALGELGDFQDQGMAHDRPPT